MSTTIDQSVVEMRFDNKRFESGVSTTMSTLDKLKQKLRLQDGTKGLENVSSAAKKVDMSGLASGVETVKMKFSALQVMGVTALTNITNQAVNAGKRIVSALTIQPIKTGFNEYELKLDSVRTIMASTGESVETVNKYLEELNAYSDQTIYSFSDMTQNIGKFTNAGVKLEDAVLAIKGISNEAAVSGANANEASRAMYNFAQALSAGYVKLIDWKSIESANMATKEFKEQLILTAVEMGTLTETSDGMYKTLKGKTLTATKNFNDTLTDQWMTSEVLINTLKNYSSETTEIGKKAFSAAQDVTKLSQMFDVLKETAQSGWAKTWEIIFGDIEKAKKLFSPLTSFFGSIIDSISDLRNNILESALGRSFSKLSESLSTILTPALKVTDSLKTTVDTVTHLGKIVNKVIRGDFGNGRKRLDALTKAGINYYRVQNEVNETLGCTFRYTEEQIAAQDKLLGVQGEQTTTVGKLDKIQKQHIKSLVKMSEEQLRAAGYTETQIDAIKELCAQAERLGMPFDEFIDKLDEINGRWLVINSFKNIGASIGRVFELIGEAWKNSFPDTSIESVSGSLFGLIEKFHKFTEELTISEDAANNFRTIFEGLFAAFQLGNALFSTTLTAGIKILTAVLELCGTSLVEVATNIAKWIISIRDWIDENTIFINYVDKIAQIITTLITGIKECVDEFLKLEIVQNAIANFGETFTKIFGSVSGTFGDFSVVGICGKITAAINAIKEWIRGLGQTEEAAEEAGEAAEEAGTNIIEGIAKGIGAGLTWIGNVIKNVATTLLTAFCKVLGIESPSTVFMTIGGFIIAGLLLGLIANAPTIWETVKSIAQQLMTDFGGTIQNGAAIVWNPIVNVFTKIIDFIKNLDFGAVLATGIGVGMLAIAGKVVKITEEITSVFSGLGDMMSGIGSFFADKGKAKVMKAQSNFILSLAIAVGILALSVYKLAEIPEDDIWRAVGAVGALLGMVVVLAAIAAGLSALSKKFGDTGEISAKTTLLILGMAAALLIIAIAVKQLTGVTSDNLESSVGILAGMLIGLTAIAIALTIFAKSNLDMAKIGIMMMGFAVALIAIVYVIKLIDTLDGGAILKGLVVIGILSKLFIKLIAISYFAGEHADKAAKMLLKMSVAMLIMVGVIKLASLLTLGEIGHGMAAIGLVGAVFAALIALSRFAGENAAKAGVMILTMSVAFGAMIYVIKQINKLTPGEIAKGLAVIYLVGGLFAGLIIATKLAGQHAAQAGVMLLMMAGSLALLSGVIFIIAEIAKANPGGLWQAVAIISILQVLIGNLIATTRNIPKKCVAALAVLTLMITVLAIVLMTLTAIDDPNKILVATAAITAVVLALGVLVYAMKSIQNVKPGPMLVLAGVIAVVLGVVILLTQLEVKNDILDTCLALSAVIVALAAALAIINKVDTTGILEKVFALTAMVVPLMVFMHVLAAMPPFPPTIATQLMVLVPLMGTMALLLAGISLIGKIADWGGMIKGIVGLTLMVIPLIAFTAALAFMPAFPDKIADRLKILVPLMATMAVLMVLLTPLGYLVTGALGGILGLTAMVIPLMVFAFALANMPVIPDKISDQIMLLVNIMTAMTLLLIPLSLIGYLVVGALGGVVGLTALVIPLMAFAFALSKMPAISDPEAMAKQIEMLVKVLAAMILLLAPLSLIGFLVAGALGGILGLTAMVIPLSVFAFAISKMPDIAASEKTVNLLVGLMRSLTTLLIPLTLIGLLGPAAFVGIAALGTLSLLIGAVGAVIIAVGRLMDLCPDIGDWLDSGLDLLIRLAGGLGEMISAFGVSVTSGLEDMGANLSAFAEKAKTFIEVMSGDMSVVATGAANLASAIGALVLAEFWDKLLGSDDVSPLAKLGDDFASFIGALDGVEMDSELAASIESLATAIATVANTDLDSANLSNFGTSVATFAAGLEDAAMSLSGITDTDVENIKRAAAAGTALAELEKTLPRSGGAWQKIAGEQDLSAFGTKIVAFGKALVEYSGSVSGGNIDVDAITKSADAAQPLSDLENSLPKAGGIWQTVAGEQDLSTFGEKLVAFGGSLVAYSSIITQGEIDVDAITKSAEAADALVEVADALPKQDGLWQDAIGEKDMATFGNSLIPFANGLVAYCKAAKSFEDIEDEVAAIKNTGTLVDELQAVMDKLDTTSWFSSVFGEKDGQGFGDALSSMAAGISSYCEMAKSFGDIEDEKLAIQNTKALVAELQTLLSESVPEEDYTAVTGYLVSATNNLRSAASVINNLTTAGYDYTGLSTLKTEVLDKFQQIVSTDTGGIKWATISIAFQNLYTAADNAAGIATALMPLNGYSYSGIDRFKEALTNLAGADVDGVIDALSDKAGPMSTAIDDLLGAMTVSLTSGTSTMKTTMSTLIDGVVGIINGKKIDFNNAGKDLATNLVSGIKSDDVDVKGSGKTIGGEAVDGVETQIDEMEGAGKDLGDGLIDGIEAKEDAVYWAGHALGQKAVEGEKDGQQSDSPSKLAILAGNWIGEGLIIGMDEMGRKVYNSGSTLGKTAADTMSATISRITSAINTDIDSQPTIRPVLDLSDVRAGADTIGSMLNFGNSVGVSANIGAISSMMNQRSQNRTNDDVIGAINKLRDKLDNVGNTTYQINGITYDDGSNISSAVETLVRAARIERRV